VEPRWVQGLGTFRSLTSVSERSIPGRRCGHHLPRTVPASRAGQSFSPGDAVTRRGRDERPYSAEQVSPHRVTFHRRAPTDGSLLHVLTAQTGTSPIQEAPATK
jgi:hypothetical protein